MLRVTGVFDFKIVLKICYKLSLVYFGTVEVAAVGSRLEALVERLGKGFAERPGNGPIKGLIGLFSPQKAIEVVFKDLNKVTKARFL